MPELNLKDLRTRFPELRLPEMSRDDIAKALGEARKELRDVRKDIEDFRREFEMPRVDLTAVDMPRVDVDKIANGAKQAAEGAKKSATKGAKQAAQAAGLVKPPRKAPRAPFILAGLVTLGLVTWALINSPTMKARLRESAQRARERMAERRTAWDLDDTRAFDAAEPAGVAPSAFSDAIDSADSPFTEPPTGLPDALGATGETHRINEDEPARA